MKKLNFLKRATSLALVSTFAATLAACGPSGNLTQDLNQASTFAKRDGQDSAKKWTFIVWLAGDNNLYPFALKDMAEMAYGLKTDEVNVVVMFDGAKTGDSAIYKVAHSDVKPKMNAPITSPKVDDKGEIIPSSKEVNSGDPALFTKFMGWATKNYPAEHVAVVQWNHGSGIFRNGVNAKPKNSKKPVAGEITTNGFAWDDHGTNMNLKDLNPAFSAAIANHGKKIDILDFDACLMSHVESAYQVKDQVSYLVASEMVEAGDGNDYIGIMDLLNKNPNISGRDFAKGMVTSYAKSYLPGGNQYTNPNEQFTLSATDTSALATGLVPAINELATAMINNASVAASARDNTTTYENDDSADLGHFVGLLAKDIKASSVRGQADKVAEELKKTVIQEVHTGKAVNGIKDSSGLVIYFPKPGDSINPKYLNPAQTKFAEQAPWGNFLKAFTKSGR